ncbi:MAPEG family protein [Enhygromyxa salina]|uniref:MAPEG family protein n=1 Tax=Enhygromyxa salina TaxID=215803 RepID=A0A2S9YGJ8_9BACT|nr:MAPEG family protein [Enhygromyxa salina]PRQ04172.1 MAPEG family protein [Enhygromyxa salina]
MTLSITDQTGPIVVTLAYLGLYYGFQVHQLRVKVRLQREYLERGEKFDRYFGQDREMLAADRTQLNMLEHMPPLLVLLWLNAVFIGPRGATIGGAIYVAARALYPLMLGSRLGRSIRAQVLIATGLGYAVLVYFMGALIWALLAG